MIRLATRDEMQAMDRAAMEDFGLSGLCLMENAGAAVSQAASEVLASSGRRSVLIFAGRGNNGGDGFVAARHLASMGYDVKVALVGLPKAMTSDAAVNFGILQAMSVQIIHADQAEHGDYDVVIDAVLGTGARGPLSGEIEPVVHRMNSLGARVIAVDIPTGVDSDTGMVGSTAVKAHITVTLGIPKIGILVYPGACYAGDIIVSHIGMPDALLSAPSIKTFLTTPEYVAACLPRRRQDGHKGDFGKVVVAAGSVGMSGAAALASKAVLHSGAGLAVAAVPDAIWASVSGRTDEVMTVPIDSDQGVFARSAGDRIVQLAVNADCLVIGPGIRVTDSTRDVVRAVIQDCSVPLVIDADAINAIAGRPEFLRTAKCPAIITPHPGELGRLMGVGAEEINSHRVHWARKAAYDTGAVAVLKGARTVVARPSGEAYIIPTGNDGMATAGSGDVLAGIIGALFAAGSEALEAAVAGAYLHGFAGDMACHDLSGPGMLAGDILDRLPRTFSEISRLCGFQRTTGGMRIAGRWMSA